MYYLYILRCADNSLYTGIAKDLKRRIEEHNTSKLSAKYTRGRRPVELVFSRRYKNRALASKEEHRIKNLTREQKIRFIEENKSS